jgi:methyl-accepting chemotaxis protein
VLGGQAFKDAFAAIGVFAAETSRVATEANEFAKSTVSTARTLMITLIIVVTTIAAGTAFFMARAITTPLKAVGVVVSQLADRTLPQLAGVAQAVAGGDLTQKANIDLQKVDVSSNEEIGVMAGSLETASSELSTAADQAGSATSGIAQSSQDMATGAEDQTKGVEQTNDIMSQLTSAIDQIAASSNNR